MMPMSMIMSPKTTKEFEKKKKKNYKIIKKTACSSNSGQKNLPFLHRYVDMLFFYMK